MRSLPVISSRDWQQVLRTNITCAKALCAILELSVDQKRFVLSKAPFRMNIPLRLAKKMPKKRIDSPLFRQFVPLVEESIKAQGYSCDPVGESSFQITPKLLQKYGSRALLVTTSACAMHCRYCFRRHYPYESTSSSFEKELAEIAKNKEIHEVILSGGDPLSLPDHKLLPLLQQIEQIPTVHVIRFHTRYPIGIPERISEEFVQMIASLQKQVVFVLHSNHPEELDSEVLGSLSLLQKAGATLLNQSVLLKGVNDDLQILMNLCKSLAFNGIIPYYLHLLDQVEGAHHFAVSEEEGKGLINSLRGLLPGYAVPRLVKEIPGEMHKSVLI